MAGFHKLVAPSAHVVLEPDTTDAADAAASTQNVEGWVKQLAQMFASGVGLSLIAERLGKPRALIERAMQLPATQALVREFAIESAGNAADKMLAGAAVDTLLTIMSIRDNDKNAPRDRLAACAMLLPHCFGLPGKTAKVSPRSALEDILAKSSAHDSIETLLDRDIMSKLEKHPELAARLSSETRPEREGRDHGVAALRRN